MTDNIRAAIADLETRRDTLTQAIETLKSLDSPREEAARNLGRSVGRSVGHIKPSRRVAGTKAATSGPNDDELQKAIVQVLQAGPASPKDVTTKCGGDVHPTRYAFKRLQLAGVVRAEGSTGNRKWMLSKQVRPAKEAP